MDSRDDAAPDLRMMARLNWLLMAALLAATVLLQGRWLTPDVYTVPLSRCTVDWHVERGIVALACPGRDLIRVWPLPVTSPWFEDPLESPPWPGSGELAVLP